MGLPELSVGLKVFLSSIALAGGYNLRHSLAKPPAARGFMLNPQLGAEFTALLQRWRDGDPVALERLSPIVQDVIICQVTTG
jgi:hypothetical protein